MKISKGDIFKGIDAGNSGLYLHIQSEPVNGLVTAQWCTDVEGTPYCSPHTNHPTRISPKYFDMFNYRAVEVPKIIEKDLWVL